MAGVRQNCIEQYIAALRVALPRARIFLPTALLLILGRPALPGSKPDIYVLRIAHETDNETACILLQETGAFHYEIGDRDNTKVYEGQLSATQLSVVDENLQAVSGISQDQIEEPLIHGSSDLLDIHLFEDSHAKELLFRSSESQEPFKASLKPLLQWMNNLHKLPHRELSEDAGKNNCLPKRALALRNRDEVILQPPLPRTPLAGRRIAPPPTATAAPPPKRPLMRLELLERSSGGAQQRCVLVGENGDYRFEERTQKTGSKNVIERIGRGQISAEEFEELEMALNDPSLARIRHHEPPGGIPINILGSVLDLSIQRASGIQDLILTDAKHRTTFFYSGDGDISHAEGLLKFVREQLEKDAAPPQSAGALNGCNALP